MNHACCVCNKTTLQDNLIHCVKCKFYVHKGKHQFDSIVSTKLSGPMRLNIKTVNHPSLSPSSPPFSPPLTLFLPPLQSVMV